MIRDDYAGPGGWSEGLAMLGLSDVGLEWDAAACATRAAAGHLTIRCDLGTYQPHPVPLAGYIASPPCQTFSAAGGGAGREVLAELVDVIDRRAWDEIDRFDDRTCHVLIAARNALALHPEWICLEQVPPVLPIWQALARALDADGWSVWAGVLCAADYGVPQTRRRAILIASRVRAVTAPTPTHARVPGLFGGSPWISWGEALGLGDGWEAVERRGAGIIARHGHRAPTPSSEPAPTITTGSNRRVWILDRRTNSRSARGSMAPTVTVESGRPAPTLTGKAVTQWVIAPSGHDHRYRLTVAGCCVLQSFAPDYPLHGTSEQQHLQVGNAVPPLLAAHVIAAATGLTDRLHHRLGAAS